MLVKKIETFIFILRITYKNKNKNKRMVSGKDYEIIVKRYDEYVLNQFILNYTKISHYCEMDIYNIFLEQLKDGMGITNKDELEKLKESIEFHVNKKNIDIKFHYNYLILHLQTDFQKNEYVVTIRIQLHDNSYCCNRESDKKMFFKVANNIESELFTHISEINNKL